MQASMWFWVLYVIGILFGGWAYWGAGYRPLGFSFLIVVLIGLLGYKVFGSPIQ